MRSLGEQCVACSLLIVSAAALRSLIYQCIFDVLGGVFAFHTENVQVDEPLVDQKVFEYEELIPMAK